MTGPDPTDKHPMKGFPQVCFIKNTVSNPNIAIGDYTYYDDPDDSENFERNVLYHFPFIGDRLIIGKFCALARGVKFIMNGANHKMSGFSDLSVPDLRRWMGTRHAGSGRAPLQGRHGGRSRRLARVRSARHAGRHHRTRRHRCRPLGRRRDVDPYAIVGGNPADHQAALRVRRRRELLRIAWWDWPIERVTRNLEAIVSANLDALRRAR